MLQVLKARGHSTNVCILTLHKSPRGNKVNERAGIRAILSSKHKAMFSFPKIYPGKMPPGRKLFANIDGSFDLPFRTH
jgi:hypothetical protein